VVLVGNAWNQAREVISPHAGGVNKGGNQRLESMIIEALLDLIQTGIEVHRIDQSRVAINVLLTKPSMELNEKQINK
jgi:hypothetical protein